MGKGHAFEISPATASRPAPVTLVMPAAGYRAQAFVTDPCGKPVPGASVTVRGNVATPHGLPAGTSYVDWRVSAASPQPGSGAKVSLILASRQTVGGHATGCHTGRSPYVGTVHHRAPAAAAPVAHSSSAAAVGWGVALVLALALAVTLGMRVTRRLRGAR